MGTTYWDADFLSAGERSSPVALIILNVPVSTSRVKQLWATAKLVYFADGGANRVYDALSPEERTHYLPDMIKGDLDSIRQDVRAFYKKQGCIIVEDGDEYATDLGKCIVALEEAEKSAGQHTLVIVGGLTGRFDQTAHTIHVLHKVQRTRKTTWVVSESSLVCLLQTGQHELQIDRKLCGPTCGLLPIGVAQATLTTHGLEWNLDKTVSAIGGEMLSTSNHLAADAVFVETDAPIIFTVELRDAMSNTA